jgi:hypothetical protein
MHPESGNHLLLQLISFPLKDNMILSKFASVPVDENQLQSPNISCPDLPEPRLDAHHGPVHNLLGG